MSSFCRLKTLCFLCIVAAVPFVPASRADAREPTQNSQKHWAFRNLNSLSPPPVQQPDRIRTGVDGFVLARLEKHGLTFSPDADRVTLIRRVFLDLIGLPPSPARDD